MKSIIASLLCLVALADDWYLDPHGELDAPIIGQEEAYEQSHHKHKKYPEMSKDMHRWGYTWDAYKVHTDDGYILTTFRITGNKRKEVTPDPSLNPVVIMHGLGCDATSWIYDFGPVVLPIPLHLFDRGFDVYMAANRGTKYCQKHETLAVDDPAFWAFSWTEMGLQDDISNIKKISKHTGKKVSYIGVSQGTVQMFYALAKAED